MCVDEENDDLLQVREMSTYSNSAEGEMYINRYRERKVIGMWKDIEYDDEERIASGNKAYTTSK